jgi:poly(beta-D-mannuronate) lyase
MNKSLFIISLFLLLISCNKNTTHTILVSNSSELNDAIKNGKPGDDIVLKNGVWKDVAIQFRGKGTKENPITIAAETAGKVSLEGKSYLKFGGEYLVVKDLLFQNGYSPSNAVVDFRIDKKEIANNCKLTNCVILDFNKPKRDNSDLWIQFWGRNNELSNSYLAGKTNKGPTVRISIEGIESINNYHQIINNHFGPRPVKGGPSGETIQLGNSYTSMSPSYTTVANNLFEKCNGEVEIISSKTNFNTFKNNVFYMSEGSVVTRHGNYATIDGNYFIGDGVNENIGGIRIINTGHWVVNNYFYNLIGENFRSPLAVMNGIPKSPLNRYNQVTDVVVAYNTYVNCESPWQFGVGQNLPQKEVLPKSEIRSARPIRTTVANNIIYNKKGYKDIVVEHDKADGVTFASNVVDNRGVSFNDFDNELKAVSLNLKKISDHIQLPTETPNTVKAYKGFDFNTIEKDLFGNSRKNNTSIGATVSTEIQNPNILDKTKYGTSWFSNEVEPREPVTYTVTTAEDIQAKIDTAENGDIINLNFNNSQIDKSIIINKTITITGNGKATLKYNGKKETPLFSLQPKGKLTIEKVILKGNHTFLRVCKKICLIILGYLFQNAKSVILIMF